MGLSDSKTTASYTPLPTYNVEHPPMDTPKYKPGWFPQFMSWLFLLFVNVALHTPAHVTNPSMVMSPLPTCTIPSYELSAPFAQTDTSWLDTIWSWTQFSINSISGIGQTLPLSVILLDFIIVTAATMPGYRSPLTQNKAFWCTVVDVVSYKIKELKSKPTTESQARTNGQSGGENDGNSGRVENIPMGNMNGVERAS